MRADVFAVNLQRTVALLRIHDFAQDVEHYDTRTAPLPLANAEPPTGDGSAYIVANPQSPMPTLASVLTAGSVTVRGRQYPRIKDAVSNFSAGSPVINENGEAVGLLGLTTTKPEN
jgi:hypothetical protein